MANVRKLPTSVLEEEERVQAECAFSNVEDTRQLVEDTTKYPFEAVAYMTMVMCDEDGNERDGYSGTGFLCENYRFLTAAHCVRYKSKDESGKNCLKPAGKVTIRFGNNEAKGYTPDKQIDCKGCNFIVPKEYKIAADGCDIAWIDLQQYYNDKVSDEGTSLTWDLTDLPKNCFYTCSIPEEEGKLCKDISICGKYSLVIHLKNHFLKYRLHTSKFDHFMCFYINVGYPGLEKRASEVLCIPRRGTPWINEKVLVQRIWNGLHLLFRIGTTGGMSGSPVYFIDKKQPEEPLQKAFVVGVVVGGDKIIANTAVPISYHLTTSEKWDTILYATGKEIVS